MVRPLALTMGEPAGIGGEIMLKAWLRRDECVPPFYLIDDPDRIVRLADTLGWDVPVRVLKSREQARAVFPDALPVAPISGAPAAKPGHPDPADQALVLRAIEPIWTTKPETASRLRGRIESVIGWAATKGYRQSGENPARWKGHLENLLPKKSRVRQVEHHAALPYAEVAAFVAELRRQDGVGAQALEFAILTGARTGEVIGARWDEINLAERLWVVPADRMKAGRNIACH